MSQGNKAVSDPRASAGPAPKAPVGDPKASAGPALRTPDAWALLQGALQKAVEEAARQAVQHIASASRPTGGGQDAATDIRKTVSEAVTSVLLETSLLDRLIERHLKSSPAAKAVAAAGESAQANPKDPSKPGRDHVATPVQGDLRALIQSEMRAFLTSQELKELLDEKFRSITLYLKNEVIPKAIRSLQKA